MKLTLRKIVTLALVAMVVASMAAAPAVAGKKKKKKKAKPVHQHVEHSIYIPQGTQGAAGCVYRTQRALYIAFGEQLNGVFGYTFAVDPKTAGLPFKLEVGDGAGVDLSFYGDLGTDPAADAPGNVGFETPGPGGEEGTVPAGYTNAFVCLTDGANATFTYTAGTDVK